MTTTTDLQALAADFAARFETAERADGTPYSRVKDGRETDDLRALILHAHEDGDILPDDFRYEFIRTALENLAEDGEDATMQPSEYTANLTAWLTSSVNRIAYLEDVLTEAFANCAAVALYRGPKNPSAFDMLQRAYLAEQDEVMAAVRHSLKASVRNEEDRDNAR